MILSMSIEDRDYVKIEFPSDGSMIFSPHPKRGVFVFT